MGNCYLCGEYGHSQAYCPWAVGKGKGQGKCKASVKAWGKDKGKGKDYSWSKGQSKGKDGWIGKGKDGWFGKGQYGGKGTEAPMKRACFLCGSIDHIMRGCPRSATRVQQVEEEDSPEVHFIGNVQGRPDVEPWRQVPMKVTLGDFIKDGKVDKLKGKKNEKNRKAKDSNRFQVLQVDEVEEGSEEESRMGQGLEPKKATDRQKKIQKVKVRG